MGLPIALDAEGASGVEERLTVDQERPDRFLRVALGDAPMDADGRCFEKRDAEVVASSTNGLQDEGFVARFRKDEPIGGAPVRGDRKGSIR